jgi:hypothetical protein
MRGWVSIAVLLLVVFLKDAPAATVTAAEARSMAGREASVRGTVTQLGQIPAGTGPLVLELDGEPRATVFRVIIPANLLSAFGESPRQRFRDREITVTGQIALYRNVPQIVVTDAAQVRIGDEPKEASEDDADEKSAEDEGRKARKKSEQSSSTRTQENLLKNADFSNGAKHWKLPKAAEVADGVLRIRLDPKKSVLVQQTFSGIPQDAIQFQAVFRAQLAEGSSLSKPLMLRLGPSISESSYLARPVKSSPGEWTQIKWTRTADLKGHSTMTFFIEVGPGEGELLIDDVVLFAHPDWKDKKTWKPSDG